MAMPSRLHVVLGATGGVGQALVQALAVQGAQVRAVNRRGRASVPASVEVMAADLTNRESTRAVCQEATIAMLKQVRSLTARLFTRQEQAQNHTQTGNLGLSVQVMVDWLDSMQETGKEPRLHALRNEVQHETIVENSGNLHLHPLTKPNS